MVVALLLVLASFGVWMYALADVMRDRDVESRTLSHATWTPVVFFGFAPGAMGWLAFGRPHIPPLPRGFDRADVVPETSAEFCERVRTRAEEQRRRYAEQRRHQPD